VSKAVKMTRLKTLAKLEARLAELGIELPVETDLEPGGPLAMPLEIGGRRIGNRFAILPMEAGMPRPRAARPNSSTDAGSALVQAERN